MAELVILDLDGVIIKGQSQKLFLNYLYKKSKIGLFFYLKIYVWFILYKFGIAKGPKKVMEYAYSFAKGMELEVVSKLVDDFFEINLKKFIFPQIIDIINEHKLHGRKILIVSNATQIIVDKVTSFLGIENCICSRLETVNGKFTGRVLGNIVYGKEKVSVVKNFSNENNISMYNAYAYADHISDLDLLSAVLYPFAVNPDRKLFKEAKKRNWQIIKF